MANPFEKFTTKSSKVKVKALGNATVEVREPTISEVADFYKLLTGEDGKFNNANFLDAKIERVANCMVSPKMSVAELKALGSSSADAIGEVYDAIEALIAKPEGEEEGN